MIRSKQPQVINAMLGKSEIVYLEVAIHIIMSKIEQRHFIIYASYINEKGEHVVISESKAVFKESTFMALFGALTLQQMKDQEDQLLIDQIDYINTYEWTGTEAQPEPVRFWNFTKDDLEIVIPDE